MKGNQGLEALAELCGGATKARVGEEQAAAVPMVSTTVGNQQESTVTPQISHVRSIPQGTGPLRMPFTENKKTMATEVPTNQSVAQEQWPQVMANAATYGNVTSPSTAAALITASSAPGIANSGGDASALNTMQQLAYFQYIQAQAAAAAQAQLGKAAVTPVGPFADPSKAAVAAMALAGQSAEVKLEAPKLATQEHRRVENARSMQKIIPGPLPACAPSSTPGDSSGMHPPAPPSQVASVPSISTSGIIMSSSSQPGPTQLAAAGKIVPLKPQQPDIAPQNTVVGAAPSASVSSGEDKKQLKRAANRRSAQLSRKRKKQFIEELKEENDELRRKEQILRSIPDLIVVFDSAGKLGFVSHSVSRVLNFTPKELEGNSFWDRLCDESVRLLKAAFMDALAARKNDMDTAPLGSGVWELRLVDKDGTHKVVTLNGVVHFSGDAPECVCSIRPRDEKQGSQQQSARSENVASSTKPLPNGAQSTGGSSSSESMSSSSGRQHGHNLIRSAIKPHQSVISNGSSDDSASVRLKAAVGVRGRGVRRATQISDDDSCVSESGSDE